MEQSFVKEGKCTLIFGKENAHIVKGHTGRLVQQIIKQAVEKNKEDIVIQRENRRIAGNMKSALALTEPGMNTQYVYTCYYLVGWR